MEQTAKGNDSYGHILKYTGLFGAIQGLSIAIALVRNKLVALILGPGGMGLMSLFNSTIRFMSDATNMGLPTSAVKQVAQDVDGDDGQRLLNSIRMVRSWALLSGLLGMVACIVFAPLLNKGTFTWGDHTLHFAFLSPVIAMMAVTGGEVAILKAMRRLRSLAVVSVLGIVGALVTSIPLYYIFGQSGIVPSLVLIALIQMVLTLRCSYRVAPPSFDFSSASIRQGGPMLRLGLAFVVAASMTSGAELLIRTFLNRSGDLDTVGIFNAGMMIVITYGSMVFTSMDTDYYPRLSTIKETGRKLSQVVNRQIEVSLLIVSPMLVALIIGLPLIVPLLLSNRFLPAVPMMQVMALALYLRAAKLPLAFIPLARGDSKAYILLEGAYDLAYVLLCVVGYHLRGLVGIGYAITLLSVLDFLLLNTYCRLAYGYRPSRHVAHYLALQFPIGIAAWLLSVGTASWTYWTCGILLTVLSLAISLYVLHSKTNLWEKLCQRWGKDKKGPKE